MRHVSNGPSSLPIVLAQSDERHPNRTRVHNTHESINHGLDNQHMQLVIVMYKKTFSVQAPAWWCIGNSVRFAVENVDLPPSSRHTKEFKNGTGRFPA